MFTSQIIKAVDTYSEKSGLAPSTICQYAIHSRDVYDRLKSGKTCTLSVAERLLDWMRDNPPKAGSGDTITPPTEREAPSL